MKDKIKWPAGNRLDLCIPLRKITVMEEGTQFGEYIPSQAAVVMVYLVGNYASYEYTPRIEDNKLFITDNGELKPGVYAIDVRIQEPERKLRSFRCGELEIVRETKQLALGDFVLDNNVTLDADAFIFGEGPSAYEVAVRDGYTGTKEEWLESMRGKEGRGIADIVALPTGAFRILLTDGSAYTTPVMKGEAGVSIVDFTVSSITSQEVLCTITMSDGTTRTVNLPRGEKGEQGDAGEDGRGIQSVVMNNDYTITFSYTDGTSYTTPQALRGEQGAAGQNGQDGRGISSMAIDENNHLTVNYTDGTSYTTPQSLQGERGVSITDFEQVGESTTMTFFNIYFSNGNISQIGLPKGEQGDRGEQGPQGPKGDTVVLGEVGEYKLYNVAGAATDGAMTQDATTKAIAAANGYYECSTAAVTAAKVAVGDNEALYTLQKGGSVKVKMTNANAAASGVTLKIGSAAATPLYYNGAAASADNSWDAGEVLSVYYDGTYYQASNAQGGGGKAEKIEYDNTQSGLVADNVQGALDEVNNAEYADSHKLLFSNSISYVINTAGIWFGPNSSHFLVDVRNIDAVRITANNSNDCVYYWFTSNSAPVNQNPAPISTINGTRYTIPAGHTAIGIVPMDAQYLCVLGTHYNIDHKPTQVIAAINFNSVADSNEEIDNVVWNDISRNARYANVIIDNSGNESTSTTRATTMLINAVDGICITANEGYVIRAICYYDNDGVFVSRDWLSVPSVKKNIKYNRYVRFIVSKEDNTDIRLTDAYGNFTITSKEYNAENNSKINQVGFVEVNPYTQTGEFVNLVGVIQPTSVTDRRLLWFPMKKGDTIHVTLDGIGNRATVFYASLNPTSAVPADLRWANAFVGEPCNTYYTAEEDGFIAVTYNDSWDTSYTFAINHADNADFDSTVIPKIACGTKIVSRLEDTYCHASMIHETTKYRFICYHASNKVTQENTNDVTYVVLLVIDKTNGRSKYINAYDTAKPDYIDGNKCTVYYNQSIIGIGSTNTLMIRVGCQCNGKWIEIYKTYNADTGVLSAATMQQLSYNGNTYDFNLANYIAMVNTLYNKSFTVVQLRPTNEITSMCYYNNKYYCVMAYACHDKTAIPARFIQCPHVFAVSDDAITWTPIANVTDDYYSAETLLTIVNDVVYHVFRSDRLGEFYMVFDMQGNVLKAPEPTNNPLSKVWSKPAIAYSGGRVLIGFNKVYDDGVSSDIYSLRTKMCLAEISQVAPYGLTEYKTYVSANGWNYYYFAPKKNGNLLVVNVEDSRGLNDNIHKVVTDVNICEVDMLELTSNE